MTGSESEQQKTESAQDDAAFVERDEQETTLNYDRGGVPLYITVTWILFIAAYVVAMAMLALPDLRAWMAR